MNNGKNYDGVSIELGQLVWGEPQTEPIVSIDPGTGETTVAYLHTWEVSQDVRTVKPDLDVYALTDTLNRPYMGTRDPVDPPVHMWTWEEDALDRTRETMEKLRVAFERLSEAGINFYGTASALLDAVERLPDEDGVVYAVKHEGPNRRERRAMARGKELPEQDPERYSSPGRLAFRKRAVY